MQELPAPAVAAAETARLNLAGLASFELLTTPVWLWDFAQKRILWGNRAAIDLWRARDLYDLQRRSAQVTAATRDRLAGYQAADDASVGISGVWGAELDGEAIELPCRFSRVEIDGKGPGLLVEAARQELAPAVGDSDGSEAAGLSELLRGENQVLELIARGTPLDQVLDRVAGIVEWLIEPAKCSILLLDDKGTRLKLGAAPNLPANLVRNINGLEVGPDAGPCAASLSRRERIVVADVETDPLWAKFRKLILPFGFHSCWTQPVFSQSGDILGAISLYLDAPSEPSAAEGHVLDALASLIGFAIEIGGRELALQSANERVASLAATIPGVVYQRLVTPDGDIRYTYISEGARDVFGVSPEEILADPQALFDCHGPEYRATFRERLLEASRQLRMWDVEAQIISRDGEEKWTHAIARPRRLPDGSVLWDGVILDATRIKRAEFAAAAAEARTRELIIESISQGFVLYDAEDRLVTCNSQFLDLFPQLENLAVAGASYETIARAESTYSQNPGDPESAETRFQERMEQHSLPQSSVECRLTGGRWILINERRSEDGSTVLLYTDVSDLKRRESELRRAKNLSEQANIQLEKANQQLDIALENMTQGLSLFDVEQRLILSNRRYADIFGLPAELTQPGVSVGEQMEYGFRQAGFDQAEVAALTEERVRYGSSREPCSYLQNLPDGRTIEVIHKPLKSGGAVETFADVTEQHRAQQALREGEERMREQLAELLDNRTRLEQQRQELESLATRLNWALDEAQAANRAKSDFLANMSHELRTPLNAVIGFSEVMRRQVFGPIGDVRYAAYANDIYESGSHLLGLINDILDLSKVEAGEFTLREEVMDLGNVLSTCHRLLQEQAVQAGLVLAIEDPSGLPPVKADGLRLKQIVLNLLNNAIKFTPPGGRVTITARRAKDGGIDIEVADTGIGILHKDIARVLQPFRQVESPMSRKHEGTGLGLPLVKGLIELHGGSLSLDSAEQQGTKATVHLPAYRVVGEATQAH